MEKYLNEDDHQYLQEVSKKMMGIWTVCAIGGFAGARQLVNM